MIVARAPLRISFFGGGTDHPEFFRREGGAVLSTAIDKYAYVVANNFLSHMFEYAIRLSYSSIELARTANHVKHNIFRECLKHCGITRNIALHSIFDTHAFSGLGTSSSLTVAVLHALHCFKKKSVAPAELAYQAIHVERNKVKSNVGFQDQIAAAYGGFNLIEFSGGRDFMVKSVSLSPRRLADFEKHIFMVYTGIIRKSSRIAGAQIKKIPQNTALLRAMKKMAYDGYDILTMGKPLKQFGTLLNEAWEKKRSLDGGISNATIDAMYQKGMKAGAWGGKLLGAGGGGFMLFFAPPHAHPKLVRAFPRKHLLPVRINAPRAQIIFS